MLKAVEITVCHRADDTRIFHKYVASLAEKQDVEVLYIAPRPETTLNAEVSYLFIDPSNFFLWRILRLLFQLPKILQFQPDFVHLHDPELLLASPIFKLFGLHVIYDMHENFPEELSDKRISAFSRASQRLVWRLLEELVLSKTHIVFAESSYRKYFNNFVASAVVQNFPTEDHYKNAYPPSRRPSEVPKFVYLGTIAEDRGALKIMRCLDTALRGRNYEIHFIGDIPDSKFEETFRRSMTESCVYHGFKSAEEKLKICQSCDVGLAILDPKKNYIESYPTKIFEYVIAGIPVIASNFELYRSVVEQYKIGLCVDPLNEEEIAEAFRTVLLPHIYEMLSVGISSFPACEFTWESQFSAFMRLVQRPG